MWPIHSPHIRWSICGLLLNQQQKQQPPTQPHKQNKSKSAKPFPGCSSCIHGQQGSNDHPTKCPAWGENYNHHKIPNHFTSVCWQKSTSVFFAHIQYDHRFDTYTPISSVHDTIEIPAVTSSNRPTHKNLQHATVKIFPDSGASIFLAGHHHLKDYLCSKINNFSKCVIWGTGKDFFLFHRKAMFCSQYIQVFVFLTISRFIKSVTLWCVLVHETGCIF